MITEKQLIALLDSKDPLQQELAFQHALADEAWKRIFHQRPDLAFALAQHSRLPQDIADELSQHPDPKVRLMLARKGNPSFAGMQRLSNDEEAAIRMTLAKRPDLDQQFAESLLEDRDFAVRWAAQRYQQENLPLALASGW
ncbi:hypothetical protein [Marinospirillum perlucidum]|uniref:hypothetical protein n=1 Tax=Marinospirillum perlucidum TaxID=1982602 RepID=UPI000DF10EC7|nr:hypothetical protein [Marinospirillum perlucidum]